MSAAAQGATITAGIIVMIVGCVFSIVLGVWTGIFCRWVCHPEDVQKPANPILAKMFDTSQRCVFQWPFPKSIATEFYPIRVAV